MSKKNGCYDRDPLPALIPLPAVYHIAVEGHHVLCDAEQMIPNVFSRNCEYTKTDLGQADKGCIDCKWRLNK